MQVQLPVSNKMHSKLNVTGLVKSLESGDGTSAG